MRSLLDTVFYMKTNVLQNFHICISVSLRLHSRRFGGHNQTAGLFKRVVTIVKVNTMYLLISKEIVRLSIQEAVNKKCAEKGALALKLTNETKLNETKSVKVIYTAITSKLVNIVNPESTRN